MRAQVVMILPNVKMVNPTDKQKQPRAIPSFNILYLFKSKISYVLQKPYFIYDLLFRNFPFMINTTGDFRNCLKIENKYP